MELSDIASHASFVQLIGFFCFLLSIIHIFSVKFFQKKAHQYPHGSAAESLFHFLGEIEVVFGLWAAAFICLYAAYEGAPSAIQYLETRRFTEPLLVFVLMVMCSTQPILDFATLAIEKFSHILPFNQQVAFYFSTMLVGPLLGSFITEPAAMTVTAFILLNRFYHKGISQKLKYATLGLLFVSVSIGGTLTSFAAPPVLMVSQKWGWDMSYMLTHFGWKAILSVIISTSLVTYRFRQELSKIEKIETIKVTRTPWSIKLLYLFFLLMIVLNHHHAVVFIPLFLFFLGLTVVTRKYQKELNLKSPLLVGFFLGGLIVLGGMQSWWLAPLLNSLNSFSLYSGSIFLTAVLDNAAITYLGSQVENLSELSKFSLVAGSVIGGGLTVIANAPNPAGYSILNPTFGRDGIRALELLKNALLPTLIAALTFWVF